MSKVIPHSKPFVSEEDALAVAKVVKSGMHATWKKTEEFENKISELIGINYGKAVTSGTTALHIALLGLGVTNEDEVIIPSYVCQSLLNAVNYIGAKAVLADIDPDYKDKGYNISARTVKNLINIKTKAIIVPHMFGIPAEINEIVNLGVSVIEDCCQSLGAMNEGRVTGSFGKIGVFSFYATKVISTGHGGMVVTNCEDVKEKFYDLNKYDGRDEYKIAFNYGFTDIQAALGLNQLQRLNEFIERRREIGKRYDKAFSDIGLRIPPNNKGSFPFRYVINLKNKDELERALVVLREIGIKAEKPVFKPLHRYLGKDDSIFPNTSEAHETALSIPIYPALNDDEVEYIIRNVLEVF